MERGLQCLIASSNESFCVQRVIVDNKKAIEEQRNIKQIIEYAVSSDNCIRQHFYKLEI
jgi:hypothetical protein